MSWWIFAFPIWMMSLFCLASAAVAVGIQFAFLAIGHPAARAFTPKVAAAFAKVACIGWSLALVAFLVGKACLS